jgi:hypothetical protein
VDTRHTFFGPRFSSSILPRSITNRGNPLVGYSKYSETFLPHKRNQSSSVGHTLFSEPNTVPFVGFCRYDAQIDKNPGQAQADAAVLKVQGHGNGQVDQNLEEVLR